MKSLFPALIAASLIHGILLGMEGRWLKKDLPREIRPRPIALSLHFVPPSRPLPDLSAPPAPAPQSPKAHPHRELTPSPHRPSASLKRPKPQSLAAKPMPNPETMRLFGKIARRLPPKTAKVAHRKPPRRSKETPAKPFHPRPPSPRDAETPKKDKARESLSEGPHDHSPKRETQKKTRVASLPSNTNSKEAMPLYRRNPPPAYPRLARRRRYQGTVVLEVLINPLGKVDDIRVFRSSGHRILDKAAVKAVRQWLFQPGTKDDRRVAMWVKVPIRFKLAR